MKETHPTTSTQVSWLGEFTGAFGDLGTFLPIMIGLTQVVGMNPGGMLVAAGLANVATGLVFRVPLAVQPMKAIAALAIAGQLVVLPGRWDLPIWWVFHWGGCRFVMVQGDWQPSMGVGLNRCSLTTEVAVADCLNGW